MKSRAAPSCCGCVVVQLVSLQILRHLRQVEKGMRCASEKRPSPLELYLAALSKESGAPTPLLV
jgi:hypothetical protein